MATNTGRPPVQLPQISPARIRSYYRSLPFFTRACFVLIFLALVLELQPLTTWNVVQWGALIPMEINFGSLYRLNTFPFINGGLLHAFFNVAAFMPLMERFEAEHGTLVAIAMFLGPFATFPAVIYLVIERFIFGGNTAIYGTSIWVFLLLSAEAIKMYKTEPYFNISTQRIPTWISPLVLAILIAIFIPGTSLFGHLCGCLIGYTFELGYLRALAPPERILRFFESQLNLLGRVPHYVSVDQKTYGRYGVLPSSERAQGTEMGGVAVNGGSGGNGGGPAGNASGNGARGWTGGSGRLGP